MTSHERKALRLRRSIVPHAFGPAHDRASKRLMRQRDRAERAAQANPALRGRVRLLRAAVAMGHPGYWADSTAEFYGG